MQLFFLFEYHILIRVNKITGLIMADKLSHCILLNDLPMLFNGYAEVLETLFQSDDDLNIFFLRGHKCFPVLLSHMRKDDILN